MPKTFSVGDLAKHAKWVNQDYIAWQKDDTPTNLSNLKGSVQYLLDYVHEECLVPSITYQMVLP